MQIQSFVYSIFADVPRSTFSHERWETKNSIFPRFIYIYFFVSSSSCQLHRVIFKIFRGNSTVVKIRKIRIVDKANKNRGLQRSRTILRSESPPHPFSFLSPRCLCLPLPCSSFPRIQSNVATLPDKSRSKKRRNALTGSKRLSVFLRHFRCDSLSLSLSFFRSSPVLFYRIGNSTFDILPIYDLSYQSLIDLYKVKIKLENG